MSNITTEITRENNRPNITDYLAGSILTNGLIWIWFQVLGYFYSSFNENILILLNYASLAIFFLSSTISSFLVCSTTKKHYLIVCLKLSALSCIFSLFFIASFLSNTLIIPIVFICYVIGSIMGGYIASKYGFNISYSDKQDTINI